VLNSYKAGDMDLATGVQLIGEQLQVVQAALSPPNTDPMMVAVGTLLHSTIKHLLADLREHAFLKQYDTALCEMALKFATDGYELEEAALRARKLVKLVLTPDKDL
jgi:hypothetical protein